MRRAALECWRDMVWELSGPWAPCALDTRAAAAVAAAAAALGLPAAEADEGVVVQGGGSGGGGGAAGATTPTRVRTPLAAHAHGGTPAGSCMTV